MEAGRSRKSPHRTPPASRTLTRRRSQQPSSSSWSHLAACSAVVVFYTRGPAALCVHAAQGDTSTTGSPRCAGTVPSPWPASPAAAPPSCPADPSDLPRQPARVALWKNTHLILAHAQRILCLQPWANHSPAINGKICQATIHRPQKPRQVIVYLSVRGQRRGQHTFSTLCLSLDHFHFVRSTARNGS